MKDTHNVILIIVSSKWLIPSSGVRNDINFSVLSCSSFLSGDPSFPHYLVAKLHLNHRKASPCVFNFSFFLSSFYYRSSSWRLYMMVHQGFNSFSKCSSRFFSKKFKHSSSCIPKCNSFYLIFWGGVMSLLTISFMFHDSYVVKNEVF